MPDALDAPSNIEHVVYTESRIHAWIDWKGGRLWVYRSQLVKEHQEVYMPVKTAISRLGADLLSAVDMADEHMGFGSATLLEYSLPDPGESVAA